MATRTLVLGAIALAVACGSESNPDCEEARPPARTQAIGEDCLAFHYGACPTLFTDCAEGTCSETGNGNGWRCLAACGGGCPSGTSCKNDLCWPRAVCAPFCSGSLCCDYVPCSDDPTTCCRLSGSCR